MISKKFDPKLFELAPFNQAKGDEIKTESLNFWQDAFRRLRQNKPSIISLYAILILVIVSFLAQLIGPKHSSGERVRYDQTPIIMEYSTGVAIEKGRLNYLPPRIPGLEKIGIADGTMKKDLTNVWQYYKNYLMLMKD